jgi:hypothetical protein
VGWAISRQPPPWIRYGPSGGEAEITFLIALNDLPAFRETLIGTVETIAYPGGGTMERIVPLVHPDDPALFAIGYHAEAIGTPGGSGASVHTSQFSHYKVRVDFATLPFGTGGDVPYYSWSTQAAEQFQTIPGVTLHFSDGSALTGDYGLPMVCINMNLTTYLSTSPVDYTLASLAGRINSVAVDSFPPYTLRFTGATSEFQQTSTSRSLVKTYSLAFRDPHWNMGLRKDGAWDTFTVGATGLGPFQATDLNILKYL